MYPTPATGTHTRIQMHRAGQVFTPHGNVTSYDPDTGAIGVLFDTQPAGATPYIMTPVSIGDVSTFTDQNNRTWVLAR